MRARRVALVLGACVAAVVALPLAGASVVRGALPAGHVAATQSPGSFTLVSTSEMNPDNNLTLDAVRRTAHVDAGLVTWDETWTIPEEITPGKSSSVTLGLHVVNNGPTPGPGQYDVGIRVIAPGLTKQLTIDISSTLSDQQTYTWTVPDVSPSTNELLVTIQPYESASATYHYRRSSTGTPTGGGGTGGVPSTPPVVVPTPSGFGQTETAPAPPPGGTAVITSPNLAGLGSVTVAVGGISPGDLATLAEIRHSCFVDFREGVAASNYAVMEVSVMFGNLVDGFNAQQRTLLLLSENLMRCVALVDALTEVLTSNKTAFASQGGCAFVPVALSTSGSGAKTRLQSFKVGRPGAPSAGLRLSCTRRSGGLTMTVATQSNHTPLSSIVGPTLRLGIVRSKNDPPGGQLSVVFSHGTSTSRPANLTGSWVNQQTPTAGPPWQLTASNSGQTLDATWTGGAGHSGLRGSFHGTLTHANGTSAYTGPFHITEAGNTINGTATFTIDNANQIEINFPPYNGQPSQHYTFVRTR